MTLLDPALLVQLALLGLAIGFVAGLLGVGGGGTLVPFVTFILHQRGLDAGLAVKYAIATAMANVLFTSMSSVAAHHRHGGVRWDVFRGMAPGVVAGGLLAGAGAFAVVKGQTLALFFAGFIAFAATDMLIGRKPRASRELPGLAGKLAAGTGIGFLSGLVGAGGGFVSVPFLVRCNVRIHQAVATSAALGLPIAIGNTVGYLASGWAVPAALPGAFGYLYLPALVTIAPASMLMAPLGARVAHAMDVRQLRRAFALLLYALAIYMLYRGLAD